GLETVGAQPVAHVGGAAVLPDDGAMDRAAGLAVPDDGGFALVGDADAREPARIDAGGEQRMLDGGDGRAPEILGLVLDPARIREVLVELLLADPHRPEATVEDDRPGTGRALVDRENEILCRHLRLLSGPMPVDPRQCASFAASALRRHAPGVRRAVGAAY